MYRNHNILVLAVFALAGGLPPARAGDAEPSVRAATDGAPVEARLDLQWQNILREHPMPAPGDPDAVDIHSRRGDACFFLGRFAEAVEEYRAMVRLRPELDASHWRLGIALYFAGQPEAAAAQFDRYHASDDVDRENGIWRFLSHYRAFGPERARKELLRYSKDDREPFPTVYRLFDGSISPDAARQAIPDQLSAAERDKRLFYTELYIGMLETVRGKSAAARTALEGAVARTWPRTAGYGPHFMWQVARLQRDLLREDAERN